MAKIETERMINLTISTKFREELREIWDSFKDFGLEDSVYEIFDAVSHGATKAWVYDGTLVINYEDGAEDE